MTACRAHTINLLSGRIVGLRERTEKDPRTGKRSRKDFSEALYYELAPRGILVTSVNPGFAATEGFPQGRLPSALVMPAEKVARVIVQVVKEGKAPEVSVPRGMSLWQAFRILTPPLYRWGVRQASKKLSSTQAKRMPRG